MKEMITLSNAKNMLIQGDVISLSPVYRTKGKRYRFALNKSIKVELSDKSVITIPKGFETDFSSVPNWLWFAFSPYGNFLLASIIHDYIYVKRTHTRKFADNEMYIWSKTINEKRSIDNFLRYMAVRIFGASWYNK